MSRYIPFFALLLFISFHQTGCVVGDPGYASESAVMESRDVNSLASSGELAQDDSNEFGVESGTWQYQGTEWCKDMCAGPCTECEFVPLCPANPGGQSCSASAPDHCWSILTGNAWVEVYRCL